MTSGAERKAGAFPAIRRVMLFGTYDAAKHPRVAVLAEGLRRHGVGVIECNAPLGLDTADRVAILRQPWRVPVLGIRLLRRWITLIRLSRRLPRPDVVLVGYMGHFDVHLARRLFRRVPIVLDHLISAADTARDRGHHGGFRDRLLRRLDEAALGAADVVVVDTEEHRDFLPDKYRSKGVVVPVGAPDRWFAAARPLPEKPTGDEPARLRVVFFGLYTPLQGAPVIGAALAKLQDTPIEITMIGSGQERAATEAAAGGKASTAGQGSSDSANPPGVTIRWLDWVTPNQLPATVASHDVCLGIFGTSEKARRVVPNKVFQGAAAGCAIVTSDTPPQRWMLGDAAIFVPAGDADALATALRTLATDRALTAKYRSAAATLARERFSAEASVKPLLDFIRTTDGLAP